MSDSMRRWLREFGLSLGIGAAALLPAGAARSQDLPAPPAAEAAKDAADQSQQQAAEQAQEAREETREIRREARDETRDAARETRDAARETVRDARTEAGETVRETAETVRETTRDAAGAVRDATRSVQQRNGLSPVQGEQEALQNFRVSDYRSADFGLWFDRAASDGLMISDVATTGMIADLGFVEGDRIISVNGRPVASEAEFMNLVFAPQVREQRVQVIVDRDGARETIVLEPSALIREVVMVQEDPLEELGIVLDDRHNDRALVWKVVRRSPAFYAGIRPGDVITAINNQRVATPEDAHQAAAQVDTGPVVIQVSRGDRFRDVEVEVVPSGREVRVPGELPAPTAPRPPEASIPPAAPPANVVNPAPAPNVIVPADPTPDAAPRAQRPNRRGLLPRLRNR